MACPNDVRPDSILIGYIGEENANFFDLDISDLLAKWPDAHPVIVYNRHGESDHYNASHTVLNGTILRWYFTPHEAEIKGQGKATVFMVGPDFVGKSAPMATVVLDNLNTAGSEPVQPIKAYVDRAIAAIESAKAAALDAAERAEQAAGAKDGGYYFPTVDEQGVLTFTASKPEDMPPVPPTLSLRGKDGESVTASVHPTEYGVEIVVRDKDGTTAAEIKNGTNGLDGYTPTVEAERTQDGTQIVITNKSGKTVTTIPDGRNGLDGYGPSASVSPVDEGVEISVTDKTGTTRAVVRNGRNGNDGHTPVKGEDYYTEQEQEQLVRQIKSEITVPTVDQSLNKASGNAISNAAVTKETDDIKSEIGQLQTSKYTKPSDGIPQTDLSLDVQGQLYKRWYGSRAEYDSIVVKDPDTDYMIEEG